jgi:hypothetical protein
MPVQRMDAGVALNDDAGLEDEDATISYVSSATVTSVQRSRIWSTTFRELSIWHRICLIFSQRRKQAADSACRVQPRHYQSVHPEHMAALNLAERRLEMQRFDAQRDPDDLRADVDKLMALIKESRKPGLPGY